MGLFKKIKEKLFGKSVAQSEKYVVGLEKSRKNFQDKFKELVARYRNVDDSYFDEVEEILIGADIGVHEAIEIVNATKSQAKIDNITEPQKINDIVIDKIYISYVNNDDIESEVNFASEGPTVILMVGVNGVGKTTTIAKLANRYKNAGKKVLLAAGDTFRAGATEQLEIWADRLGVDIVKGKLNSDPSSVMFDACKKANQENYDILICDTAGRLQTKVNLMNELAKIRRVIGKEIPDGPHEVLLVIDATTGQNGVFQAKAFAEATGVNGIVLTKMDGTSKGGIILAIKSSLGIPVKFIGLGEKMDDLEEFDLDQYLNGLFVGNEEEGE